MMNHLFCFGFGYVAQKLVRIISASEKDWTFSGTKRVQTNNFMANIYEFDSLISIPSDVTHILISIPPKENGDIVFEKFEKHISKLPNLQWIGYLSTTGVYGDTKGEWVNEDSPINPANQFSKRREVAEKMWTDFAAKFDIPIFIFRLSGIYGPGRSVIDDILIDKVKIIDKKDQVFSRVHVHDIAHAIQLSMQNPLKPGIYNLADDYPCGKEEVVNYACKLLNIEPPKPVSLEDSGLSEMGKNFYKENRRVSNEKVKNELGLKFKFPTFKEGVLHILNS